jgi:TonB family protein
MTNKILILLIFIPTIIFSQPTTKIKDKENKETFYVLKSDNSVRQGEYIKRSFNNSILVKGFYKNGLKDSIWEFFNSNGEVIVRYDYSIKELLYKNSRDIFKGEKYKIADDDYKQDTSLIIPPFFLGGDEYILDEIINIIRYPDKAREYNITGTVYVSFTIDKNGKTSNYRVENPLGYGLDEEAIRVLKFLPDYWLPALIRGQAVEVEYEFPIHFKVVE